MEQQLGIILGKRFPSMGPVILLPLARLTARSVEEATQVLYTFISTTKVCPSGFSLEEHQYQVVIMMTILVIPSHLTTREIE